ncbi:MAG: T9SS type A sorting domain-containing protein, partial [Bacteroidota bacterium]
QGSLSNCHSIHNHYYFLNHLNPESFNRTSLTVHSLYINLSHSFLQAINHLDSLRFKHFLPPETRFPTPLVSPRRSPTRAYLEVGTISAPFLIDGSLQQWDSYLISQEPMSFSIQESPLSDTLLEEAKAGLNIQQRESSDVYDPINKAEITQLSLEARVLSRHTAFLCLEDSTANGFVNSSIFTGKEESKDLTTSYLSTSPNPFAERVFIDLDGLSPAQLTQAKLHIFTIEGQYVGQLQPERSLLQGNQIRLQWDGNHSNGQPLPAGVYLLRLGAGAHSQTLKLVKR